MSIAKLKDSSSSDAMKLEEGNDSLDTFIRQAIGKEPALSFSRTNDSQVQWIQLLHALDQQDLPGWPMLTPLKVQMQKCDKCSREFCSPINYRRHIRVHRRSFYVDKESHKNRDLLGGFWDKFSLDEAKELVSFKDVMLEGVPGSSIIEALESFIRKPGFVIPQAYVKAGSVLLDVIQARPSRLPISSQELFSVLDDASERTFLCAGSTESMQKYVFDGEAGKIGLEMKNLVAFTSFLIEQKLLKAWLADKDAEALRCQKLLVEEEEAAQRRQAELLERKRQKKLRQEQKAKEQLYKENPESKSIADILKNPPSAEPSSPQPVEASAEHVPSHLEPLQATDIEVQVGFNSEQLGSGSARNVEPRNDLGHGRRHLVITRRQVPKSQWGGRNGFHHGQNLRILKPELVQKNGPNKDIRAAPVIGSKVWTRKTKIENGRGRVPSRGQEEDITEPTSCELMIGSIPVPVRNFAAQQQVNSPSEVHVVPKKSNAQDKLMKPDSIPSSTNRSTIKIWRPISSHGTQGEVAVQSGNQESKDDSVSGVGCELEGDGSKSMEIMQPKGLPFSSQAARAFLAQRWKEAISGDHLTLVLSPEPESQGSHGSAENPVGNVGPLESSNRGHAKGKLRRMPGKGVKKEYIPKQRSVN